MNVYPDPIRGHIAIGNGRPDSAFVDLSDGVLRFWAYERGELDPTAARDLAAALIAWADRQDSRP